MTGGAGRLAGRIALITGASRGIGAAIAERYAREGAHLILIARTVGGLEEVDDRCRAAGGQPATLVPLDLRQHDGIDNLGAAVFERFGRLDVLVGNAAMLGALSPLGHIAPEQWDQVLALNLTANWRLIRIFDPLLRRSDAGRAIFLTSGITRSAPAYWGAYAASKAALETLVRTYAAEIAATAVRANLVNPGPTRTHLRAQAFPGEDPAQLPPAEHVCETLVRIAEPCFIGNGLWVAADQPSDA
jgi:NAD(P)-dependent dehydrogenase (short-subunit alcohol dehydrogenase family)